MNLVSVEQAAKLLGAGEIVGIPTDTVYGLAVDPRNPAAIDRLFTIKGRSTDKPIGLLAADAAALGQLAVVPDWATDLIERHWPGPLTLVCSATKLLPDGLGDSARHTVGVRVPNDIVAQALLRITGPLAVTSANLSGGPECHSHEAAYALLGETIGGYVDGHAPIGAASTVVDVTGSEPVVLRAGPVVL